MTASNIATDDSATDDVATDDGRSHHRTMLWASVAMLLLALVLHETDEGRVAVRGLPSLPLPHTCMSRQLFGVECPGCGLTRSVIHLAEGDLKSSWQRHRLGWLLGFAIAVQIPYRLAGIYLHTPSPLGRLTPRIFSAALILALMVNWLLRFWPA